MYFNMGMKKDKSCSEVFSSDDAECSSLRAKKVVCDKSHLSVSQSDKLVRVNDVFVNSFGSSESNTREMVIENPLSSELAQTTTEIMTYNNHSDVRPNSNEEGGRATKSGEMALFPSCTELEKKKPCSSAAVSCNDQEKVEAAISQTPSCSMELQVDAPLDAADPLLDTEVVRAGSDSCDSDEKAHQYDAPDHVEVKRHPLISPLESEEEDADLEEQDVKVCDICGDAGREDLLAICSKCSDGAEHTYCMREMLDDVPEGHWLCEECKSCEEMLGVRERSKRNSDCLLEKKDPSSAGNIADNDCLTKRLIHKRRGSDMEIDPAAKKQVLESMVQSPNTSIPARDGALSRDNSFKNIDKMNAKPTHQTSISGRENLEKPRSSNANLSNATKGSYFKSNSFGSSSSVPKVKMVVEIPQKHKQGGDFKDASSKILSKSLPLKGSLSRSNTTESKVKMLSPKDSHILESRGLKQAKERNLFERKNSIKLDHSSSGQVAANGCKNQARGEGRRQHSSYPSSGGSSSTNAVSGSADMKSNLPLKEGCTSSLSRLDGVNSDKNLDKIPETSSVRSLKDGLNEENKLKAAIQAAMQKRLDMCRRNKAPDKSSMLSVSNADSLGEKTTLDRPNSSKKSVSEGMHETEAASPSSSLNCVKEISVSNVNQSKVLLDDSLDSFQARNKDLDSSDVEQIWRRSAIPEHEFAWIGSFEVYRGGSTSEQVFGIQAHLSTCASNKVLEMVKKFPQKVPLSEVPRSGTWPVQFQDGCAEEDNIAIYFFAKDVESYERSYKNLLEKLMKEDLALKGNIDGIDLLIFPSKQLMKRSQRWNMLFFIWGVFRGRKENCLDNKSSYVEKLDLSSLNTGKAVTSVSLSENTSIDGCVRKQISTSESEQDARGHNAFDSGVVLAKESPKFSNGGSCLREHSLHKTNSYTMKTVGRQDSWNESDSTCYNPEANHGTRYKSTLAQVELGDPDSVKDAECRRSSSLTVGGDSAVKVETVSVEQSPVQEATCVGGCSENKTVDEVKSGRPEVKLKESVKDEGCQMKLEGNLKKEDTPVESLSGQSQITVKDNSRQKMQCKEEEKIKLGDVKNLPEAETGRFLFPVDLNPSVCVKSKDDLCSSSGAASVSFGNGDSLTDGFPNLELGLGVENRTKSGFFLGFVDDQPDSQNNDVGRRKEDEERSSSAALCLSLAFPFGDKERSECDK